MKSNGEDLTCATSSVALIHASAQGNLAERTYRPLAHMSDLELVQCALVQRSDDAWNQLVERFQGQVLAWVRHHAHCKLACQYHDPAYYVALAFERFWQSTARNPFLRFRTLEAALSYLKASLNGAILDTIRTYARPEIPLPEAGAFCSRELAREEVFGEQDAWDVIKGFIPTPRERRVAYLLFHCGLKPREIVQWCADEFPEVHEVHRLRRHVVERLLRHAETIRWHLGEHA